VPLPALEPVINAIRAWAESQNIPVHEGLIELDDSFPQIDVIGFDASDSDLFLTLAKALVRPVIVLNAPPLNEEDLRLAKGLAGDLPDAVDKRYYGGLVAAAKSHLGKVHNLTAHAFAPDLSRVVTLRAATDWAEPIFGLLDRFSQAQ